MPSSGTRRSIRLRYQPHPTVFERAGWAGVAVTVVGQRRFRKSGLTAAGLRSPGFSGADSLGERVAAAALAAEAEPSLVYVYDGDLDVTGHHAGCESAAWRHQLVMVDRFVEELAEALPAGTTLVVTADHGMVDVDPAVRVDVDDLPALREGVALVGGEARFRHVYAEPGAAADVRAAWQTVLGVGPRCFPATRRSRRIGSARSKDESWTESAMSSQPWVATARSRCAASSRSRPLWWACTERSPPTRCSCRSWSAGKSGAVLA